MTDSPDTAAPTEPRKAAPFSTMIPFKFEGSGEEYFGIWISNIFFTIITLGIYSAWAKVRNLRYFHRSTSLDGARFDYHADPVAILKGRLIAIAVFILYSVVSELHIAAFLILTGALMVAVPWVIVRSLKFRFVNTSYRNVRMGFDGDYRGALINFILIPLMVVPTFGLLWPYIRYRQKRYVVQNLRYGTSKFSFEGSWVPWFKAGLPLVLIGLFGIGGPIIYLALNMSSAMTRSEPSEEFPEGQEVIDPGALEGGDLAYAIVLMQLAILLFYIALPYYIVTTRNLLFEMSSLGAHGFQSSMRTFKYAALLIGCFFIVAFTLGFGTPWAKVIMARYKADTLEFRANGALNDFVAQQVSEVRALGEELGEAFDIDVGI